MPKSTRMTQQRHQRLVGWIVYNGAPATGPTMRRRDVLTMALGSAAGWPLAAQVAWGQRPVDVPAVGVLWLGSAPAAERERFDKAVRDGLRDNGLIDGVSVRVLIRRAENDPSQLPDLARELAEAGSRLIVTAGTTAVAAVHGALPAMPIVAAGTADPVETGLAQSLARPGGKITGISILGGPTFGKHIEVLKELVPSAKAFAALLNAANPGNSAFRRDLVAAGQSLNVEMHVREVRGPDGLTDAFEWAAQVPVDGVYVIADPIFGSSQHLQTIAQLAEAKRLPWIGGNTVFARVGAVAGISFDYVQLARDSGRYVTKILRGADPAELPIEQPNKFLIVINLKAARALGITVPSSLLVSADEVIE